jgi:phospholipid/cholesterol/gamma-HCH transport system substrate-binding protein
MSLKRGGPPVGGIDDGRRRRYKIAGALALVLLLLLVSAVYTQFRGGFTPTDHVRMMAGRAGLVMEPGALVTYNGVPVGRVAAVQQVERDGTPKAELTLDIESRYTPMIPANVDVSIDASTVFGKKYVSFLSPKSPFAEPISADDVIDATSVTTEFNTVFDTVMEIAEKVDPVKLNMTLTASAEALQGLGRRFGSSIGDANTILAELNAQMPQIRYDLRRFADLADIYANNATQLWNFLGNAARTAASLNEQRNDLDAALLAAIGFGNTGTDILERGSPYLVRGLADLVPTAQLFDEYSPAFYCLVRNYHDLVPKVAESIGGNGYSALGMGKIVGAGNSYVYPDNLPRVNARGGPGGRPGCWQPITRDLWPAPYLVMDTGNSLAPYNHLELGQPLVSEYVWGRQLGQNTINP